MLTPALIRGWVGLPQLGVTSAAAASIASFIAALAFLAWHMRRGKHPLAPDRELLRALRIDPRLLQAGACRIGLPTGVQMIVISLAEIALLCAGQPLRLGCDGRVWRGQPGRQLRAVPGAVDRDHRVDPRRAGDRRRRAASGCGAITRTGLQMNLVLTGALVVIGYLFSRHLIGAVHHQRAGGRAGADRCCTSCCGAASCSASRRC